MRPASQCIGRKIRGKRSSREPPPGNRHAGRIDELQVRGQWERLLRSGARFAAKSMMLSATADDPAIKVTRRWCLSGYGGNGLPGNDCPNSLARGAQVCP